MGVTGKWARAAAFGAVAAAAGWLGAARPAAAEYPDHPVKVVVPPRIWWAEFSIVMLCSIDELFVNVIAATPALALIVDFV